MKLTGCCKYSDNSHAGLLCVMNKGTALGTADVSLLWLFWDSVSCMLDARCRMAFLAVSPSSFIFFFLEIPYTVRSYEVDPFRQTSWNEWKQPYRRVQFSSWLEMLLRGKSHFFVCSGLISQRYPKGKTVIFIFLLGDIVGSMTWVGTLVLQLLFEENWLCLGLWEIFINMEDSAWAHLTFSKRSNICITGNFWEFLGIPRKLGIQFARVGFVRKKTA